MNVPKGTTQMIEFKMTAGTYYITDACMAWDGYYDGCLLGDDYGDSWSGAGCKKGSSFVRATGYDGAGDILDMNNQVVGHWGSDAANVSVIPAKVVDREVPAHYGMKVTFDEDFVIKSYHDTIVIGDRYRVRAWRYRF